MKSKKTKTIKTPKAEHKDTRSERDRFAVVLEALQADFRIFGEKLDFIEEKFEKRFTEIDLRFDKFDTRLDKIEDQLDKIEDRLDAIEIELASVKLEMAGFRGSLAKKADLDRWENLEKRVLTLEKLVAAR